MMLNKHFYVFSIPEAFKANQLIEGNYYGERDTYTVPIARYIVDPNALN